MYDLLGSEKVFVVDLSGKTSVFIDLIFPWRYRNIVSTLAKLAYSLARSVSSLVGSNLSNFALFSTFYYCLQLLGILENSTGKKTALPVSKFPK